MPPDVASPLILIADDNPEDREFVRRTLAQDRDVSYQFAAVDDGVEALRFCRDRSPDCLILDYEMPDLDGLELLFELNGEVAKDDFRPPFPIVMITGRGGEAIAIQAMKRGADDYLIKGQFTPDSLRHAVREAIARVRDRDQIRRQAVELERLYAEAREADRRKDEFLAMLAHELRNPLSSILNAAKVLSFRTDPPTLDGMREIVERQARHLARLVDDLLDVSRITRGKIQIRKESAELAGLVRQSVEVARPLVTERGHDLTVRLPDAPVRLDVDPARFVQVLVNLLDNAAKYTEAGGRIDLAAEAIDGHATIRVVDSGIGIDPDVLPKVFDLFAQADGSLDRSRGGLGIGLTLVKRLVELNGGTVGVRSEGLGKGSEFMIRIPVLHPNPAPEAGGCPSGRPAEGAKKILVVDDNVASAETLALLLGLSGHSVLSVHSGPEALATASEHHPDVIVLDIGLPGMDGFEVARNLRCQPDFAATFLIALTGYGQDDDRRKTAEAGFDRHLVKPVDLDVLNRILEGVGKPSAG